MAVLKAYNNTTAAWEPVVDGAPFTVATGFAQRNLVTAFGVYAVGDFVVLKDGREVLIKTAVTADSGGGIPSANYVLIMPQFYIFASAYGVVNSASPTDATANTAALQAALNAANPTNANGAGGIVIMGRGNFYTNAFISIPIGVCLAGNSTFGTYWSLADNSNCSVVGPKVSPGGSEGNSFYWGLRDLSIDCRQATQGSGAVNDISMTATSTTITSTARPWVNGEYVSGSGILPGTTVSGAAGAGPYTATMSTAAQQTLSSATVYTGVSIPMYGVHATITPLTSFHSGDWGFDPSGFIFNVVVKNSRDAGFANFGRSANVYLRCKQSASLGIGFIGSFDTRYLSCESDFSAWHGFDFRGSSEQIANCKSYNSGQAKTTVAAASNVAHGYVFNGFSTFGSIAIAGCDAQQNTGNAYELLTSQGIALSGCTAAYVGYTSAVTTAVGFHLDNSFQNAIQGTVSGVVSTHCLSLTGGSDLNDIRITHFGAVGAVVGTALLAGTALLTNGVWINGNAVNAPGLVSTATLDSAYPKRYSITTTGGSHHNIGMTATQGVAVLNRMELVPFFPERGATQTMTELTMRVGTGNVATAVCRQGLYSSNKTGGNVFTLEQELPATQDCSVAAAVKTQAFTTPITVDPAKMYWIASVPQVALAAFQTCTSDHVAGSTANPNGGYCYTQNTITGALPATITFSTTTAPVHLASGIAVGITVTG